MPVRRSGARKGRAAQALNRRKPADAGGAIATRTRRRRAVAAETVAGPVDNELAREEKAVDGNVVAESAEAEEGKGQEAEGCRVILEEGLRVSPPALQKEGVGEKPMDDFDSGAGRSNKGPAGEDEGSTAPLPEKVCALNIRFLLFLLLLLSCRHCCHLSSFILHEDFLWFQCLSLEVHMLYFLCSVKK